NHESDLWSVMTVNRLPFINSSNLSTANIIAKASCSRVEYSFSAVVILRVANATVVICLHENGPYSSVGRIRTDKIWFVRIWLPWNWLCREGLLEFPPRLGMLPGPGWPLAVLGQVGKAGREACKIPNDPPVETGSAQKDLICFLKLGE